MVKINWQALHFVALQGLVLFDANSPTKSLALIVNLIVREY